MPESPVFDQVNIVVRDMESMVTFYRRLGLDIPDEEPPWDRHHRSARTGEGLDLDLDSQPFARLWNTGMAPDASGPVLGFKLPSREAVDQTYADLTAAGHACQKEPWDAFWGARYAIVADPDGNFVGLMSPIDPSMRTPPPDVSHL